MNWSYFLKACFLPITLTRPDLFSNSPSMAETKEDLPDPTVPTTCNSSRAKSFTSLKADPRQYINGGFAFSRYLNGTFP